MVTIITAGMIVAILTIVFNSNKLFEDRSSQREGDSRQEQASIMKAQVETKIQNFIDKARIVGGILYKNFPNESDRKTALESSFYSDRDLVHVEVLKWTNGQPFQINSVTNEAYLKVYDKTKDFIVVARKLRPFLYGRPFYGEVEIQNSSIENGVPLITVGVPLIKSEDNNKITEIVLADFRLDAISENFKDSSSASINYLVDREGRVLAHPDETLAVTGQKINSVYVNWIITQQTTKRGQKAFVNAANEEFIGAFARTKFGSTVVSEVPMAEILAPSKDAKREAFKIMGIVVSLTFLVMALFSNSLTQPLEKLVETTNEIAKGNFEAKSNVETRDEVGELAKAFDKMVDGLKERDKVKTLFGKFHGTDIAQKLMDGEMSLGGEKRTATVFFSDIRGFTSFSEKIPPEEVVDMLNEYFKIMVQIIQKNHGVVDKFIGDAIMAVWGAPESHGDDEGHAIRAALEMRVALNQLNEERIKRGQPELLIGMGLHTGTLVTGTIGSDDRMEYTVIGDSVNMASRIEAATKAYGTDLLISENTCDIIKDRFLVEQVGEAEVKGKSEPLKLFTVKGYMDANGAPIEVSTPYSSYEASGADKVKTG